MDKPLMGFSGARITIGEVTVLKETDTMQAVTQAAYMDYLQVGPRVIGSGVNGDRSYYIMEKLTPLEEGDEPYGDIIVTLQTKVWNRQAIAPNDAWLRFMFPWLDSLPTPLGQYAWKEAYHHRANAFHSYTGAFKAQLCLTHGDPTLSNVYRGYDSVAGRPRIYISDPVVPHTKIPSLPEVDLGRLLQSAFGWEDRLRRKPITHWPTAGEAIEKVGLPFSYHKRALFWAGVNALRVAPYAERIQMDEKHRQEIMAWSRAINDIAWRAVIHGW